LQKTQEEEEEEEEEDTVFYFVLRVEDTVVKWCLLF